MNRSIKLSRIIMSFSIIFIYSSIYAQMEVTNSNDATYLAELLSGPGVLVSNAVMNCPDGAGGYFENADSTNLGIGSGVVLTSGSANDTLNVYGFETQGVAGPNSGSASQSHNAPGDFHLDSLIANSGFTTNDACILEFDISTGCADTITFNYVFGSDEYHEFVCSSFNDAFGLLVTGLNPAGGTYNSTNVAIIPGTNTPVSIDNVNNGTNDFYTGAIEGGPCTTSAGDNCPCNSAYFNGGNGDGFSAPFDTDSFTVQYDGLTVVLQARFAIVPFETYHLKLAIADAGDWSLDSGVFIEAGSISASTIEIDTHTDVNGYENLVEGCVNGIIDLALIGVDTLQQDTVCITLNFGGTAINGIDYVDQSTGLALDSTICIFPGDTGATITISALADGVFEGTETIIIEFLSDTCGFAAPPLELEVVDNIDLTLAFNDTTFCAGQAIQLFASGANEYVWTPNIYLNSDTIPNPILTPFGPQTYNVVGNIGPCIQEDSVVINVFDAPIINLVDTIIICNGLPVVLDASNSIDANQVDWSPIWDLNDPTILNPTATPLVSTWYYISAANNGGCSSIDSVFVEIVTQAVADAGADQLSCNGAIVSLSGSGAIELSWSPAYGLSCYDCPNPTFTGYESTTYILNASYSGGQCADTDTVEVEVFGVDIDAGPDYFFCNSGEVLIGPEYPLPNLFYMWEDQLGNTYNVPNPLVGISIENDSTSNYNTFTLTVSNTSGCIATDQVVLTALADPIISGGENDTIFEGNSTILSAGGVGNEAFYNWQPEDLILGLNGQTVTVAPSETTVFTVTGISEDGCEGEGTVTVVVEQVPEVIMPTAFSPNGDGKNDILKPTYLLIDELITYQIYNRWGELLFSAKGDFNAYWDGNFAGKKQEVGVYIFFIEASSAKLPQTIQLRGNVTLVR